MDPNTIVTLGLTALDEIIAIIKHIRAQGALTTDQIVAMADAQDLKNKEVIKALIAL